MIQAVLIFIAFYVVIIWCKLSDINDNIKKNKDMTLEGITKAFNEGVEYTHLYGLDWRKHMRPLMENGWLKGYYIMDESFSTVIKTVRI